MKSKLFFLIAFFAFTTFAKAQEWSEMQKVLPDPYQNCTYFYYGNSVAVNGNIAVVGAPYSYNMSGVAYVYEHIAGIWLNVAMLTTSDPAFTDNFGISVSVSGDVIVVGAQNKDNTYTNSGAVYVFEKPATGWTNATETAKLIASDQAYNDYLGYSVSIDGNTIAAGSYADDDMGSNSGSVYIFEKTGAHWVNGTETAKLLASDGASGDSFGRSVAISGSTVVVGAYQHDNGMTNNGSAYVFEKPLTGWVSMTETARLTASDASASDYFGYAVAVKGNTVAVTANMKDYNGTDAGMAYVFEKPVSGWATTTETAKLYTAGPASYRMFGASISMSDNAIVVGATNVYSTGFTGAAYVFEKPVSGWVTATESAMFLASDKSDGDNFGISVGIADNVIICGSYWSDLLGSSSGSAYIYEKPATGWTNSTETTRFLPEVTTSNTYDEFSRSLDISGDYAVVGSANYNAKQGRATVLHFNGLGWDKVAELTASDAAKENYFGYSVAISDSTIVVGAYSAKGTANITGKLYLFKMPPTGWFDMTETAVLLPSDLTLYDNFGYSVDIDGDVVVASSPMDDDAGTSSGSVYVFEKPASGWTSMTETAKLRANDGASYDSFGNLVKIKDSLIVVSANIDDVTYSNQGSAYVFVKPATGWATSYQTAKLVASDPEDNMNFCSSIAFQGENIVIGTGFADVAYNDQGTIYVYERPLTGWTDMTETARLTSLAPSFSDNLGMSVAANDTMIIAGAPQDNNKGLIYVFKKPASGWISATENYYIAASDGAQSDFFGNSIALDGKKLLVGSVYNDGGGLNSGAFYFFRNFSTAAQFTQMPAAATEVCDSSYVVFESTADDAATFNWQSSSDNGANWVDLIDGSVFSGSETSTLTIFATQTLNNCQFRCIAANIIGADTTDAVVLTFDTQNPVITSVLPDLIVAAGNNCETTLADYTSGLTVTDNCSGIFDVVQIPAPGTTINGPVNIVELDVTDASGNTSHVSFNITVTDMEVPVITSVHPDLTVAAGTNCETVLADYTATLTATDNCAIMFDVTQNPAPGTLISGTVNSIELTATDGQGNSSHIFFNIAVMDSTAPAITSSHPDLMVAAGNNCETTLADYTATLVATDNCTNILNVAQLPLPGTIISGQANLVELTVSDDAGNSSQISFNVAVIDSTAPEIICVSDQEIYLQQGLSGYTVNGTEFDPASVTDNCTVTSISNSFNSSESLDGSTLPEGVTSITWTATDADNNTSECSITITVYPYVSIGESQEPVFTVSPNPATDYLYINGNNKIDRLEVTDLAGQRVLSLDNPSSTLDVSSLQPGIYLLRIFSNNQLSIKKIQKQ